MMVRIDTHAAAPGGNGLGGNGLGGNGLGAAAAVLWDVDGTLLLSGSVAARAFLDAIEDVTGTPADPAGIDFGGRIDPEIAGLLLAAVGAGEHHVPAVLDRLRELMAERADALRARARALPGVVALLDRLAAAGVVQTVVTGNVESVGRLKLDAAGLVPPIDPGLGGFGDSGTDRVAVGRSALLRLFGADWPAMAHRCWIVGDTPRDVACARALGLRCALVATGRHPAASMAGLGADAVLESLEDGAGLRRLWDGTPTALF